MQKYVTFDDIEFVENKIKKLDYYPTPNELWKEMKGRFKRKCELGTIIDHFLNKNKIILDKRDGKIVPLFEAVRRKREGKAGVQRDHGPNARFV